MEEYFGEEYEDEEYLPFQEEEEGKNSLHYNLLDSKTYLLFCPKSTLYKNLIVHLNEYVFIVYWELRLKHEKCID